MKIVLAVLSLMLFPILCMCLQEKNERPKSTTVSYELYSWQNSGGQWCFSILTMTDRAKTAEDIFDKQESIYGIDKLKETISRMRPGTRLVWMKNPWQGTAVKGTESVVLPPGETMNEVKRFAARKHVVVTWSK